MVRSVSVSAAVGAGPESSIALKERRVVKSLRASDIPVLFRDNLSGDPAEMPPYVIFAQVRDHPRHPVLRHKLGTQTIPQGFAVRFQLRVEEKTDRESRVPTCRCFRKRVRISRHARRAPPECRRSDTTPP